MSPGWTVSDGIILAGTVQLTREAQVLARDTGVNGFDIAANHIYCAGSLEGS